MIHFTSDCHFGHEKILSISNRPFARVSEMDAELIKRWNLVVGVHDTVFVLGDFCLSDPTPYLKQLNGEVYLVKGNHDPEEYLAKYVAWVDDFQGECDGEIVHLYHYPLIQWYKSHDGSIHLHGHVHGYLDYMAGRGVDVGVDSWEYLPINMGMIKDYVTNRPLKGEKYRLELNAKRLKTLGLS